MDIYLIELNCFTELKDRAYLKQYQHKYAHLFLAFILKTIYGIESQILIAKNGKPYITNNPIYFSISHSQQIIALAISQKPIGIDIEFKKVRKYNELLNFLSVSNIKNITQEKFYQLWTMYEAEYKSQIKNNIFSFSYGNYICSVSSECNIKPTIYEIKIPRNIIKEIELTNLKLVNDNAKKENEVVIKEINIASSDVLTPLTLNIE